MLTEQEWDEYNNIVSDKADGLIQKGYKQWRKERRELKSQKKHISQEDRVRQIEEEMIEQGET